MDMLNITSFLNTLEKSKEKYQKENKNYASDFNIFEITKIDENRHSTFLAELLSPEGTHAQGSIFYKAFLNVLLKKGINIEHFDRESIDVAREQGRIDILITPKNSKDFAIIIENKIDAKDQPKQIDRYRKQIKRRNYGIVLVIYLTPSGEKPSEKSISKDRYEKLKNEKEIVLLSYNQDIVSWLRASLNKVKPQKVKNAIEEYIEYLEFGGGMKLQKHLTALLSNDGNFEIAKEIVSNWSKIISQMNEKILKLVKRGIKDRIQTLGNEWILSREGNYFYIKKQSWKTYYFAIGYEGEKFYMGIYKKKKSKTDKNLRLKVEKYLSKDWEISASHDQLIWACLKADIKPSKLSEIAEYYINFFLDFINKFKVQIEKLERTQ